MQPTKDFPAPTDEAAYWACIGFRHDFGLLPDADAQRFRAEGLAWLAAWRTGFADGHESASADGLGNDWDEPFANTIDAACLTFDPGFRARPLYEASAIRRGGIEWLQAWRKAFEDQGLKNRTPSAGLADHAQRPAIRATGGDAGVAARCAALVRCAEAGVPTDVQALLVQGDPMRGIRSDIVGLILGLWPVQRERGSEFAVYGPDGGRMMEAAQAVDVIDAAQAVDVIDAAVLAILAGRREANPDQPFVDFRSISGELGLDHETTWAILGRLKKRRAILWKWDFPGGDARFTYEGGGFASLPGVA